MCAQPLSDVLHRYVVPWLQADWPLDWSGICGRAAPLVVEIGFGNGRFLIQQAERHPDANLVGVELSWGWVQHLAKRLDEGGLMHVRLIHGSAQVALRYLFSPNSIDEIFINFPDPWPKKRHHERRLIQTELVELVHDRLAPSGQVTIATDHSDYATWIAGVLEGQTALHSRFSTTVVHELTSHTSTKYEQRARRAKLPIYYFVWHKPFDSPRVEPAQKGKRMPHVVLAGPYDIEQALRHCTSRTWRDIEQGVEVSTAVVRAYRELTANSWLVELVVKEGKLCQQIGVRLIPRSPAQVLLKLAAMGFPRPTWGVQRAVWHVAQMLQEHNPQLCLMRLSMATPKQDRQDLPAGPAGYSASQRQSATSDL